MYNWQYYILQWQNYTYYTVIITVHCHFHTYEIQYDCKIHSAKNTPGKKQIAKNTAAIFLLVVKIPCTRVVRALIPVLLQVDAIILLMAS